jgi:hypothetical protein
VVIIHNANVDLGLQYSLMLVSSLENTDSSGGLGQGVKGWEKSKMRHEGITPLSFFP